MKANKLTLKQEEALSYLLKIIGEQSVLSLEGYNPVAIKIPFSNLENIGISFSEAKELIKYLDRKIGSEKATMSVLNGTISIYRNRVITMVTEVAEDLYGVDIDDEKDSLILHAYNLNIFLKNAESFLNLDLSKLILGFGYKNGEKIILQIDEKRKEIMRKDNNEFRHSFRRALGINKRFGYLIKIHQNPKISGTDLGSATLQNLSKEIRELNETFKEKLKLPDELIINNDNSGYEINRRYFIEFI